LSLPGVSIKKDEVSAVVELLTADGFDTPEQMARAVLNKAYELFEEREWHVIAMRNDGGNILFGPYGTENAAVKSLEKNDIGVFGQCAVFPVHSATRRREFIKEAMRPKETRVLCANPDCAHLAEAHGLRKSNTACSGRTCKCTELVRPEK
jgi:hypothetical protein